tara:strand:+ start:2051 stop:2281 length:231 start_codon:yes stop_codon:yes gene_type:complete
MRILVDTKKGKVWANTPENEKMVEMADIEKDSSDYLAWNEMVGQIRAHEDEDVLTIFEKIVSEKFKKGVDSKSRLG